MTSGYQSSQEYNLEFWVKSNTGLAMKTGNKHSIYVEHTCEVYFKCDVKLKTSDETAGFRV